MTDKATTRVEFNIEPLENGKARFGISHDGKILIGFDISNEQMQSIFEALTKKLVDGESGGVTLTSVNNMIDVEQQTKTKTEPTIQLFIEEAEYALKCIRYLASGFDFEISKNDTQKMWDFADVIYRRVKDVK